VGLEAHEDALRTTRCDARGQPDCHPAIIFPSRQKVDPAHAPHPGAKHPRAEYTALQNAYRTLSNGQSRADYDRSLQQQSSSPGAKRNAWQVVRHER